MRKNMFRGVAMSVAAIAAVAGLGTTAALAVVSKPKITVTPHAKLVNAQVVVVAGTGFPANDTLVISQCNKKVNADKAAACDLNNIVAVASDATGKVPSTNFTVHSGAIGTDGGTCDKLDPCTINVSEPSPTTKVHASAKVSFA